MGSSSVLLRGSLKHGNARIAVNCVRCYSRIDQQDQVSVDDLSRGLARVLSQVLPLQEINSSLLRL